MSSGQVKMHRLNHTQIKRVDINDLMLRVRNEKRKERKESLVFIGLISSVLIATGLIASL
jgi:hypothetical protein